MRIMGSGSQTEAQVSLSFYGGTTLAATYTYIYTTTTTDQVATHR